MKRFIKSLIPSFFFHLFRIKNIQKTYQSYDEALSNCISEFGYEQNEICEVVFEKTKGLRKRLEKKDYFEIDATTAYGLTVLNVCLDETKNLVVLDYGGACGLHYFIFRHFLSKEYKLNWNVVETPQMVKKAQILENDELSFYSDIESAIHEIGNIDLLFSSGTLQYVRRPLETLEQLVKIKAQYFFLSRLSLTTASDDVVSTQKSMLSENGMGELPNFIDDKLIEYPHTNLSEKKVISNLLREYDLVFKVNDVSGIHKVNSEPIIGYGLFLKKKF